MSEPLNDERRIRLNIQTWIETLFELQAQRDAAVAILRDYLDPEWAMGNEQQLAEQVLAALGADAKEPIPSND